MDENKNKRELDVDQLEMVTGGGTKAAEDYLQQLMDEKGVERWDLFDNMTPEEYQHYYNLYYDIPETSDPPVDIRKLFPSLPDVFKRRQ